MTLEREAPAPTGADQGEPAEQLAQANGVHRLPRWRINLKRMPARVGGGVVSIKKPTMASAAYRLHQLFGESPATWENRMWGATSDYQQVARCNLVLRELGMADRACELMAPIDASLAPAPSGCLTMVLHEAEVADAAEQLADETFRHKLAAGTATVADARDTVRKSAIARTKAEIAEAGLQRWISQQGER